MKLQHFGIGDAWKAAYLQPFHKAKHKQLIIHLNMLKWHYVQLSCKPYFDHERHFKSQSDVLFMLATKPFEKIPDSKLHACEIEEIRHEVLTEEFSRMQQVAFEYESRIESIISKAKAKGTWKPFKPLRFPPDWQAYLLEATCEWGAAWNETIHEIHDLQPYVLGTPNALQLDEIGKEMRAEHVKRSRQIEIGNLSIDDQIACEIVEKSKKSAENAVWRIEFGLPIGKPTSRKPKGASAKTEQNENETIEAENGLKGFKKPIEIGTLSKEDAEQSARCAVFYEWQRIKHAFKTARKNRQGFFQKNKGLKRHMARVAYRAALKDLTNWDGWREKKWLVKADSEDAKNEVLNVALPIEKPKKFMKSKPRWISKLNQIAKKRGLLATPAGKYQHKEFLKMMAILLQGRNPNKKSNHLQATFKRYGICENTFYGRKIERLEKWQNWNREFGWKRKIKSTQEAIDFTKKCKKSKKSLESFLCNMPLID